jgi:hypothetical protein
VFKPLIVIALIAMSAGPTLATELQDPMAPFTATGSGPGSTANRLVLSAIIISEQRRVAIINDQPYQIGYRFRGYELTAIEANSVEITRDGTSRTLRLGVENMEKSNDPS